MVLIPRTLAHVNRLQDPLQSCPDGYLWILLCCWCYAVSYSEENLLSQCLSRTAVVSPSRLFDVRCTRQEIILCLRPSDVELVANWGFSKRDFIRAKPGRRPTMWTGLSAWSVLPPLRVVLSMLTHIKVSCADNGPTQAICKYVDTSSSLWILSRFPHGQRTSCRHIAQWHCAASLAIVVARCVRIAFIKGMHIGLRFWWPVSARVYAATSHFRSLLKPSADACSSLWPKVLTSECH